MVFKGGRGTSDKELLLLLLGELEARGKKEINLFKGKELLS